MQPLAEAGQLGCDVIHMMAIASTVLEHIVIITIINGKQRYHLFASLQCTWFWWLQSK